MQKYIATFFLVSVFCAANVYAEELSQIIPSNKQVSLEDENKIKPTSVLDIFQPKLDLEKKIMRFLDVGFQKHLWGTSDGRPMNIVDYSSDMLPKNNRWFLPLFLKEPSLRTEGMPKYDVINKWKYLPKREAIKVDLTLIPLFNSNQLSNLNLYQQSLEVAIQSGIQALNAAGAIQLSYDKPFTNIDDLQGTRIHIIPYIRNDRSMNPRISDINSNIGGGVYHYSFGMIAAETMLKGAVRFAPSSPAQVDGYFIPDKNNNIVAAVCYINVSNPEDVQKSYINECLLRSLGFPEVSKNPDGVLSLAQNVRQTDFTPNDLEMLKLLYSPEIKAGDDKYAVIEKLKEIQ